MSFIDDVQGQNTQLYPVVVIDGNWYSTNNVVIDDNYCKPLLLNIPSIKESIDIESKKFKISSVTLDISNINYQSERFSDRLGETSLINAESIIYFKSPSDLKEVYRGIVRRVTHDDVKVTIQLEDLTEKDSHVDLPLNFLPDDSDIPDKYKNTPIPMVYGHVNKSPVVIGSNYAIFHADSKMIHSFVRENSGYKDTGNANLYLDPLQVHFDDEVYHVDKQGQYVNDTELATIEFLPSVRSHFVDTFSDQPLPDDVHISCSKVFTPNVTLKNEAQDPSLINEDFLIESFNEDCISGITGESPNNPIGFVGNRYKEWINQPEGIVSNSESLLLSIYFDVTPSHETLNGDGNKILGFKMNGYNLPKLLGYKILKANHVGGLDGQQGDTTPVSDFYDNPNDFNFIYDDSCPHSDIIQEVIGFYNWGLGTGSTPPEGYQNGVNFASIKLDFYDLGMPSSTGLDSAILLFRGGYRNSMAIELRSIGDHNFNDGTQNYYFDGHVEVTGSMHGVGFFVKNDATNALKQDFYANVNGRVNIYEDHPAEEMIPEHTTTELYGYTHEATDYKLIENPIDIIYSLVREEIEHDNIDEAEYLEARAEHTGWKFAFTVDKKINSKKLIEDIAKSTKSFPRFNNDGTFGFSTIKKSYTVSNENSTGDYENARLIKGSDVISYSFKKTKPEQIYPSVDIKYKKDYAQGSYLKSSPAAKAGYTNEFLYSEEYYADNSNSLSFESDYIRDDVTANLLQSFLLNEYKFAHLIFNLKLPLKYIDLKVGKLLKFRELLGDVKAYGKDYRILSGLGSTSSFGFMLHEQYAYPLFIITSVTKNLDSVSVECMQLHHHVGTFTYGIESDWFDGIGEGDTEGLFYFPDADPITITPTLPEYEGEMLGDELVTNGDFSDGDFVYYYNEIIDSDFIAPEGWTKAGAGNWFMRTVGGQLHITTPSNTTTKGVNQVILEDNKHYRVTFDANVVQGSIYLGNIYNKVGGSSITPTNGWQSFSYDWHNVPSGANNTIFRVYTSDLQSANEFYIDNISVVEIQQEPNNNLMISGGTFDNPDDWHMNRLEIVEGRLKRNQEQMGTYNYGTAYDSIDGNRTNINFTLSEEVSGNYFLSNETFDIKIVAEDVPSNALMRLASGNSQSFFDLPSYFIVQNGVNEFKGVRVATLSADSFDCTIFLHQNFGEGKLKSVSISPSTEVATTSGTSQADFDDMVEQREFYKKDDEIDLKFLKGI